MVVTPPCQGEEVAEPEGEALDLPAAVRPIQIYGRKIKKDQKNESQIQQSHHGTS